MLKDACVGLGIEPTTENMKELKRILKKYFQVGSVSLLSDRDYGKLISATQMIIAREMGVEIPLSEAEKTMRQLIQETTDNYDDF